ncbi:TRAP transporter substrate-binding protein [Neorhizobium petrolearium]|uniref:TRAP transporter substrate-binding protein n=1 Tax=Neorhizobium petrolearium TaxID=515361 RepID=UPI003F16ABFB
MKAYLTSLAILAFAATAARAETFQFAGAFNDKDQFTILAREWADKVKTATNGAVTFDIVSNGALVPLPEALDSISLGVVPAGMVVASFVSGTIPAMGYAEMIDGLPVENPSTGEAMKAIWDNLDAVFNQHGVTALFGAPAYASGLVCRKDFLKAKADWTGKKIRTAGRWQAQQVAAMGAVPMPLPPSELYVALQNGVVDCALMTPTVTISTRLYEVAPFYTNTEMAGNITTIVMNLDVWKKLPEAQRTAIRKVSDEMIQTASTAMRESAQNGLVEFAKTGKVYQLNAAEQAEFAKTTGPIFDKVAANVKDAPGTAMIKTLSSYRK